MKISDLLSRDSINLNIKPDSKSDLIDTLVDLQYNAGNISDKAKYRQGILERENIGTTALGDGFAIPHAKSDAVVKPGLAAATIPLGVDFDSMDGEPTNLIFMIAAPNDGDLHIEMLSRLTVLLMSRDFRFSLINAKTPEEFISIIDEAERERYPDRSEQTVPDHTVENDGFYRILAVTACPTGIAHTFMAAEALENKAKEMGLSLKAETNGSGGAKNVLTPDEIEHADGIIIAADRTIDMARFDGKRVVRTKVSDGIHHPEKLIDQIISAQAPIYRHDHSNKSDSEETREGAGRTVYKHLMNGVSHMLPFVTGGGILIALAFLFDNYAIDPSNFGSNTPFAAFIKAIGSLAFNFMLPILAGYIAMSIGDRPALLVGFVGGQIANLGITFTNVDGGVSAGFLGALIAGFAAGYIVLLLRKICDRFPPSLEGIKPILIYPIIGLALISVIMCAINPIVSLINTAVFNFLTVMGTGSKILLGCILGGMMSIDMGGPFNKAAYVFGTAAIASGSYDIMAAVMIGGMIPPIALALCMTFFKSRFSPTQRKSCIANYIMGLCFITEGAIPFAAADPLRVLPACIIGSATAGGLSMALGCTLMAPHGGIFVFPVIGNALGYTIALAVGSVVGMLLLALFKRRVPQDVNS